MFENVHCLRDGVTTSLAGTRVRGSTVLGVQSGVITALESRWRRARAARVVVGLRRARTPLTRVPPTLLPPVPPPARRAGRTAGRTRARIHRLQFRDVTASLDS